MYINLSFEEGEKVRQVEVTTVRKKIITALELTTKGKIKRMYTFKLDNYSAKKLETIFEKHIDKSAKITTNKWKVYRTLSKNYNITQIESNQGKNLIAFHTRIHQVKSWIRTTYSSVSNFNSVRYLDAFCYRINQSKNNIY